MTKINAVIDLYHGDTVISWAQIRAAGVLGVIHKATQGLRTIDHTYYLREHPARDAGLMWGAYHFATDDDGVAQAKYFLDAVKPDDRTLLALDFEPNGAQTMTAGGAEHFVQYIHAETGRWPVLYTGQAFINESLTHISQALRNCPLWIARYSAEKPQFPSTWNDWTLWQYTGDGQGPPPHTVPGIVGNVDREYFNGDENALRRRWGYPAK